MDAETVLNAKAEALQERSKKVRKLRNAEFAAIKKQLTAKQPELIQLAVAQARERGEEVGLMGHLSIVKRVTMDINRQLKVEG